MSRERASSEASAFRAVRKSCRLTMRGEDRESLREMDRAGYIALWKTYAHQLLLRPTRCSCNNAQSMCTGRVSPGEREGDLGGGSGGERNDTLGRRGQKEKCVTR